MIAHLAQLKLYERPREKLHHLGPTNLTTVELLALLLGSGTRKYPVLHLASQIEQRFPHQQLLSATVPKLTEIPGLGEVQAGKIVAALELGRRLTNRSGVSQILKAEDALKEVSEIRHKTREHLIGVYLNARHEVVHKEIITIGGLNTNSLEVRDVFVPAFKYPCLGIILAHNHPSGDPEPSHDDILMTKELQSAGELLGIKIVDHLVVTDTSWCSILTPPPKRNTR